MSVGATITISIANIRQPDVDVVTRVAAISFNNELEAHGLVSPPTSDVTANPALGTITRVITANFTPEFMAAWPADADRISALQEWIVNSLSQRIPFIRGQASEVVALF